MMQKIFNLLLFVFSLEVVTPLHVRSSTSPLYLTELIRKNKIAEARKQSSVPKVGNMDLESYSGFLTVRTTNDVHLFFWFFPAKINRTSAPVILWSNGGPGVSALSGLFAENGPYYVTETNKTKKRPESLATKFNVIYLDSPVQTGFSFSNSTNKTFSHNLTEITEDNYNAVLQFFLIFPEFSSNAFYPSGESYAGKYAVDLTRRIDKHNNDTKSKNKINLKGPIVVSGFIDPVSYYGNADYYLQTGLIDSNQWNILNMYDQQLHNAIANGNTSVANQIVRDFLSGNPNSPVVQALVYFTGYFNFYNLMYTTKPAYFSYFLNIIGDSRIRKALHVGDVPFQTDDPLVIANTMDLTASVVPTVAEMLDRNYTHLFASGNLDMYLCPPLQTRMVNGIKWSRAGQFNSSAKTVWRLDQQLAGYVKILQPLWFAVVRNAGHRLPADQLGPFLNLVQAFTAGSL